MLEIHLNFVSSGLACYLDLKMQCVATNPAPTQSLHPVLYHDLPIMTSIVVGTTTQQVVSSSVFITDVRSNM